MINSRTEFYNNIYQDHLSENHASFFASNFAANSYKRKINHHFLQKYFLYRESFFCVIQDILG